MVYEVDGGQHALPHFTAYSDPDARELGSIYQALNFYYLGTGNGVPYKYENPYKPGQLVTDRFFRIWRTYRRYAAELGIEWQSESEPLRYQTTTFPLNSYVSYFLSSV